MPRAKKKSKAVKKKPNTANDSYRSTLIKMEHEIGKGFDKTSVTLSGGGLGLSFAFIKNIIGTGKIEVPGYLMAAWVSWAGSLAAILGAYYCGTLAYRHAVKQVDTKTIKKEKAGGAFATLTHFFNALGAILFFTGTGFMIWFVYKNLGA